ncbi:MAG: ribosome silencing factor [Phycisphaerae bacterium]|nr:ribosome silencing factor [Phycisphaerae bacterium]
MIATTRTIPMATKARSVSSVARMPHEATNKNSTALDFATDCARSLRGSKCENVVILDVRELSQVTRFIVIGSGTSDRQMNSALDDVAELGEERGLSAFRTSKDDRSTWLLADFVEVVVHLFEPNTRAYYDLEMLWGDAPRVTWRTPNEAKASTENQE